MFPIYKRAPAKSAGALLLFPTIRSAVHSAILFPTDDRKCNQRGGACDGPRDRIDIHQHLEASERREDGVDPGDPQNAGSQYGNERRQQGMPHAAHALSADFIR